MPRLLEDTLTIVWWKFNQCFNCSVFTQTLSVLRAKGTLLLPLHRGRYVLCRAFPFPSQCRVLVEGVDETVYRRKFRERLGELTPRNLDHPVPVGLVDIGGRRALIYGNPWRGLSSHPVPVLHPTGCKGTTNPAHWPAGPVDGAAQILLSYMNPFFNMNLFLTFIEIQQNLQSSSHHDFSFFFLFFLQCKDYMWATLESQIPLITVLLLNRFASAAGKYVI